MTIWLMISALLNFMQSMVEVVVSVNVGVSGGIVSCINL